MMDMKVLSFVLLSIIFTLVMFSFGYNVGESIGMGIQRQVSEREEMMKVSYGSYGK